MWSGYERKRSGRMNDLIKRRDATKVISISCGTCLARDTENCDKCSVPKLCKLMNAIPSADLSSEFSEWARHWFKDFVSRPSGMWIRDEFGSKCSCCGLYAYRDKFDKPWESFYCPNCGAKMKGAGDGTD